MKDVLIIESGRIERQYWRDLWAYRELLFFLAWRDILVRYKQTVIGLVWSILKPLLAIVVFTIVFSKIAHLPSPGVPYPLLIFSALLPWQFFANALTECGNSILSNSSMVSKVYFPRMIAPLSAVLVSLADLVVSLAILAALMTFYGVAPTLNILLLPLCLLLVAGAALGAGLWLAALSVKFRDFRYIIPFIVQFGLYVSPVGFTSSLVPVPWRPLYALNPMVGIIDGFRWALLGGRETIFWPAVATSLAVVAFLLVTGVWYFRRTERTFADII